MYVDGQHEPLEGSCCLGHATDLLEVGQWPCWKQRLIYPIVCTVANISSWALQPVIQTTWGVFDAHLSLWDFQEVMLHKRHFRCSFLTSFHGLCTSSYMSLSRVCPFMSKLSPQPKCTPVDSPMPVGGRHFMILYGTTSCFGAPQGILWKLCQTGWLRTCTGQRCLAICIPYLVIKWYRYCKQPGLLLWNISTMATPLVVKWDHCSPPL